MKPNRPHRKPRDSRATERSLKPEAYDAVPFSEADWDRFSRACARLDIPLTPDKRSTLEALYGHLVGVNTWMNLTRLTDAADYLKFHLLDSLTVLPEVSQHTRPGDRCADVGSGGGYPGLPLMLWRPDRAWALVDSRKKKVDFLNAAIPLTGCAQASAHAFRAREAASAAPELAGECALVTARAVADAPELLREAAPLLQTGGHLVILKGPAFDQAEAEATVKAAARRGYRPVDQREATLADGDPRRMILVYQYTR